MANEMTYLDAAEKILREFGGTMSASEIVRQIVKQQLIHITGKTPLKSMNARLSVDIKNKGENSRFKRVDKGKYTLRSNPIEEYQAIPHQRVIADTDTVLAFPSKLLDELGHFHGIRKDHQIYEEALLNTEISSFLPRLDVEMNPLFKQIVSYVIVRYQDMLLRYTRGVVTNVGQYLHGEYSLGFGGHVEKTDWDLFSLNDVGYRNSVLRELKQEIEIEQYKVRTNNFSTLGVLNDDSSALGRCHIAFIHLLTLDTPEFKKGEKSINDIKWVPINSLGEEFSGYEYWSKLCIQTFFSENLSIPCYIYEEHNFQLKTHSDILLVVGYIGSGKTEACNLLEKEFGYILVPCSRIMQEIIGCPPIDEIGRERLQNYGEKFIKEENGHERLSQGIIEFMKKHPGKKFVLDGLRFPETFQTLQKKSGKQIAVIYIETTIDNLYDYYVNREAKNYPFEEFLKTLSHPVEREIERFRLEADITIYNHGSKEFYIKELRNFFKMELE